MGASCMVNWKLEMSEESHSERVEVKVGTMRKFNVPFSGYTCESYLKESKIDRIINKLIGRAPEVICHHVGLWILLHFSIKFGEMARKLHWNWRPI